MREIHRSSAASFDCASFLIHGVELRKRHSAPPISKGILTGDADRFKLDHQLDQYLYHPDDGASYGLIAHGLYCSCRYSYDCMCSHVSINQPLVVEDTLGATWEPAIDLVFIGDTYEAAAILSSIAMVL